MQNKKKKVFSRRNRVMGAICARSSTRFDEIVEETKFSRNEAAFHLALLVKKGKISKKTTSEGIEYSLKSVPFTHEDELSAVRSLNLFLYGCERPIHSDRYGYVDPHSRLGKSLLDP